MSNVVLARGFHLDRSYHVDGWMNYLNGEYTDTQTTELVDALVDMQTEVMDRLLPEGCTWWPRTGEIWGPDSMDSIQKEDYMELLDQAQSEVDSRFGEVEARVLGK